MTDDELLGELTDAELKLATKDNALFWRELARLRVAATIIVTRCERLDAHGFDRAIDAEVMRGLAAMLPKKPDIACDIRGAHSQYKELVK